MNITKKITLALGLIAAASSGIAQSSTAGMSEPSRSTGLLGQRYTELAFGLQDVRHVTDHGYSVGAGANDPVIPGVLDAGASYSYSWFRGAGRGHANTIGAYATAYLPLRGLKPFVGTGLGYQWISARSIGNAQQALWGLTAGVEIPAGRFTFTPRISYADDFEGTHKSRQDLTVQVEANYWYSNTSAVFGSIGRSDVRRSSFDAYNYQVGLRARF
jgi:hypothetical protein